MEVLFKPFPPFHFLFLFQDRKNLKFYLFMEFLSWEGWWGEGFRATLTFEKIQAVLNPFYKIFKTLRKGASYHAYHAYYNSILENGSHLVRFEF